MDRLSLWLCILVGSALTAACATGSSIDSLKPDARSAGTTDSRQKLARIDASSDLDMRTIDDAMKVIQTDYISEVPLRKLQDACLTSLGAPITTTDDVRAGRAAIVVALEHATSGSQPPHPSPAAERCLRAMVKSLNAHSDYIGPREFEELKEHGRDLAGIGVELEPADQGVRIVGIIEGGPSARAGISAGTMLTRIDDQELNAMPVADAVRLLRGDTGSSVRLALRAPHQTEPYSLTLQRQPIRREGVHTRLLERGVALVRMTQLDDSVPKKMADGLADIQSAQDTPLEGVVLDLRGCHGGLLNVSVAISAAFLPPKALIVYTTGRTDDSSMRLYSSREYYVRKGREDPYTRLPPEAKTARMVVLVSQVTAAGAEAIAAALQDHKRATVVGTRTYGKGFVETILRLRGDVALKLTTASMYRSSGKALQDNGVTPDVVISRSAAPTAATPRDERAMETPAPTEDRDLAEAMKILRQSG
jgi:carboxyl-terminal processing protease